MIAYLSFESLKLQKRWMPRIILGLVIALLLFAFWGQATRVDGRANLLLPRGWLASLTFCSYFAPFFWPVLGGSWGGNEYGWGTIRAMLTRRPNRIEQALSALIVLLAGLAIALLALLITGTVAGLIVAAITGNDIFASGLVDSTFVGTLLKGYLITWYVSAFYLLLAYVAAVVFRSAAVGIGIGIGGTLAQLVVANIFSGLGGVWTTIAQHFPFTYSEDVITRVIGAEMVPGTNMARTNPSTPSAGASVVALGIYAAILLVVMLVAVRARDVTD